MGLRFGPSGKYLTLGAFNGFFGDYLTLEA